MNQRPRGEPPWTARVRGALVEFFHRLARRVTPGGRARATRREQLRALEHQARLREATGDTDSTNKPQLRKGENPPTRASRHHIETQRTKLNQASTRRRFSFARS